MSHSQAVREARAAHRKKEFRALKSGRISQSEYDKRIAAIERKYR